MLIKQLYTIRIYDINTLCKFQRATNSIFLEIRFVCMQDLDIIFHFRHTKKVLKKKLLFQDQIKIKSFKTTL